MLLLKFSQHSVPVLENIYQRRATIGTNAPTILAVTRNPPLEVELEACDEELAKEDDSGEAVSDGDVSELVTSELDVSAEPEEGSEEDSSAADVACDPEVVTPADTVAAPLAPAALSKSLSIDFGMIQVLAPTLPHKLVAKLVALSTSLPLHFSATHWPTNPAHWGITQKHPVSQ